MLITDIINQASSQLREVGIETPEHDARLLFAEAAGVELCDVDRALLMEGELGIIGQLTVFRAMLDRRARREPPQYITGYAPFRHLDLKVDPGVFTSRPETETVVQAGLDWLTRNGMTHPYAVDLYAGSGAIGLFVVGEMPGSQVQAVELSLNTAEWARRNLSKTVKKHLSIASNYHLEIVDAIPPATLVQLGGATDIVIANPSYVPQTDVPEQPEVRDWGPGLALYGGSMDGTLILERIIERVCRLSKSEDVPVMEHYVTQGDRLVAFARATGFAIALTGQDWMGHDRYLFAMS